MQSISLYLEKFKNLGASEGLLKQTLCALLKSEAGVAVEPHSIRVQGDAIFIETSPSAKSEVFMKKEVIQNKLQMALNAHAQKNIR